MHSVEINQYSDQGLLSSRNDSLIGCSYVDTYGSGCEGHEYFTSINTQATREMRIPHSAKPGAKKWANEEQNQNYQVGVDMRPVFDHTQNLAMGPWDSAVYL